MSGASLWLALRAGPYSSPASPSASIIETRNRMMSLHFGSMSCSPREGEKLARLASACCLSVSLTHQRAIWMQLTPANG